MPAMDGQVLTRVTTNHRPFNCGRWGLSGRHFHGTIMKKKIAQSVKLTAKQVIELAQALVWLAVLLLT